MIPPLYDHQKRILKEDKKKCGLFLGTGAAKTRTALELSEGFVLVICPKTQKQDRTWERNAEKFGIVRKMMVVSKEEFRRDWHMLPAFDSLIIDEGHTHLGVTPMTCQRKNMVIPKTSQIFEATLNYIRKNPPKRFYLCSATPANKPMNVWAIGVLFGQRWNFFDFRDKYYIERRVGQRRIWIDKKDKETKDRLASLVQKLGYTGGLNDFFDVPDQTHKEVKIELTKEQKDALKKIALEEADPLVKRAKMRTIENGLLYAKKIEKVDKKTEKMVDNTIIYPSKKIEYILERATEFPKILIFAQYTAQINEIAKALRSEGYEVSELTGKTKNRGEVIANAEKAQAHIVIAQSSVSAGYELPSFPCVIYASKSWQFVNYEQSLGRVLRSNALKKNLYIHLIVDGCDADCHKAIMSGADFQEKLTLNY